MTPAVSVCVPVFNGAPHIAQALRSVLDQTYTDFELVVVDNRSTDGTADIVRGLADERVRLVEADVHVDAAANFTRATGLARGRYVKLLCADDALAPRCLERQVAAFEAPGAEAVTLVAARRDLIDEEGRTVMRAHGLGRMTGRLAGPEAIRRVVRSGGNPLGEPAAVLMRGDALRAVGGWSGDAGYAIDLDMWFRLLARGDLVGLPESLAVFRVHRGSWSASITTQARETRALHRDWARRGPTSLRRRDRAVGAVAAQARQLARKVVFAAPRGLVRGA